MRRSSCCCPTGSTGASQVVLVGGLRWPMRWASGKTNVLYLLVFGLILLRDRKLIRYGLCMILPGAIYGLYNTELFGAPWRTGYFRHPFRPRPRGLPATSRVSISAEVFLPGQLPLRPAAGRMGLPQGTWRKNYSSSAWFAVFPFLLLLLALQRPLVVDAASCCRASPPVFLLSALSRVQPRARAARKAAEKPAPGATRRSARSSSSSA